MTAVILAGGAGLRLREAVRDVPKPMAPVAGKPFLEYIVIQLGAWDIRDVVLATGYKGDVIERYFGDGRKWGARIRYSREAEPLGTGGALKQALALIDAEDFVLTNGDSFFDVDVGSLLAGHRARRALLTIALVALEKADRYGTVSLDSEGRVTSFSEKRHGGAGLVNGGVYVASRRIADRLPAGRHSFEADVIPDLAAAGEVYGGVGGGFFIDIGIPEDYAAACGHPERLAVG